MMLVLYRKALGNLQEKTLDIFSRFDNVVYQYLINSLVEALWFYAAVHRNLTHLHFADQFERRSKLIRQHE